MGLGDEGGYDLYTPFCYWWKWVLLMILRGFISKDLGRCGVVHGHRVDTVGLNPQNDSIYICKSAGMQTYKMILNKLVDEYVNKKHVR